MEGKEMAGEESEAAFPQGQIFSKRTGFGTVIATPVMPFW
jgi:hypothetical protein